MKQKLILIFTLLFGSILAASEESKTVSDDFTKGSDGWTGDFADYPVGAEAFFELAWGWDTLPEPLEEGEDPPKGIFLYGNNHSDDLFMFIKKQMEGLKPDTDYELIFSVTIAADVPAEQCGIGGSPGESVYFKVGASSEEPIKVDENGTYRMNIDIGRQSQSGENGMVVGTLANPMVDPGDRKFHLMELSSPAAQQVKTDSQGRFWVFAGTDSGFEGSTLYYITRISIEAVPL
jgi:hypothetical protein